MAIKADRSAHCIDRIDCVSDAAVEAGQGVILTTPAPSGTGLSDGTHVPPTVAVPTGQSLTGAKFVGIAMQTVKVLDLAVHSRNDIDRSEQVVGEPFRIGTDVVLRTNKVTGTPAAEDPAYVQANGNFGPTQVDSVASVGKFKTPKDADGYAKISIKVA